MTRSLLCSFRSEWLKLSRPAFLLGTFGGVIAFSVLGVTLGMRRVGHSAELSVIALSHSTGFATLMSRASGFIGIIGLGTAAFAVASEYSHGTIRNLLVRESHRLRLLGGKALALASFIAAAVALSFTLAFAVALLTAPGTGVDTSQWTSPAGIGSFFSGTGDAILAALGYGLLGGVLGLVLRSPAPAIVAGIAYVLPVEALLVAADSSMRNVLYGQQLDAIAAGGNAQIAYGAALAVAAAWAVGVAAFGGAMFSRRDVVA